MVTIIQKLSENQVLLKDPKRKTKKKRGLAILDHRRFLKIASAYKNQGF